MAERLLLITGNYSPEPTGIGKYNGEMMQWLAEKGYDCTVITTYPYYPHWKIQAPYEQQGHWYKKEIQQGLTVYRCPQYIPAAPSGMKRVLMDASFFLAAFFRLFILLFTRKFDVVMVVVPPFHLGFLGLLYKWIRGARLLYHIQDLQIEAARDLQMIRSRWLINTLFRMERFILHRADLLSSISEGMMRKIAAKSGREIFFFPNWVALSYFFPINERQQLKAGFGFRAEDKVILYSGAIGEKQGLESILDVAITMQDDPRLKFLICGAGPYKTTLENKARSMSLQNVIFYPTQASSHFNRFLNMADIHLVIQKANAADLVMPSKLTTILAVEGLALITANEGTSLYELVRTHELGIVVAAENQQALYEGLLQALNEDSGHITSRAGDYARNFLAIDSIMTSFEGNAIKASR
ncbi:WcaI family glycosyltransferase [Chitinophaga sancti]|uniref:Colanic acid biosynthesis glycosyl transferase WcaI n=1 Tax=Chitinophaga sancti TaxID=1004 RepID=A0A1K1LMH7_9BACT|nr:WcaI family glycosyltransferase [Chitinophaga sancti]WQD65018.1 WcaI family glycosyltransferase [Chitinophaga sancti]WQG89358.1 WcaI family glycosyltransferase [Chitinophaga sancti]SFW12104.1 colanic acid biosynthesis glycosyl transferase WcaI [Chitinophaga sancti]